MAWLMEEGRKMNFCESVWHLRIKRNIRFAEYIAQVNFLSMTLQFQKKDDQEGDPFLVGRSRHCDLGFSVV